jgi:hypothetical protein
MKVTIPDSWNEVTIGQFMEISTLDRDSKDYSLNILSILLDKDPEEIRKFDGSSLAKIIHHIEWAFKTPDESSYNQIIEVEGKEYFMIENLNHFTGGQWWDMEEYLEDYNNNLHCLFAIIYGSGKEYNAGETKKIAEIFKDKVTIGQVYGSLVFFSIVEKECMINIPIYLSSQMIQKTKPKKKENKDLKKKKKN